MDKLYVIFGVLCCFILVEISFYIADKWYKRKHLKNKKIKLLYRAIVVSIVFGILCFLLKLIIIIKIIRGM